MSCNDIIKFFDSCRAQIGYYPACFGVLSAVNQYAVSVRCYERAVTLPDIKIIDAGLSFDRCRYGFGKTRRRINAAPCVLSAENTDEQRDECSCRNNQQKKRAFTACGLSCPVPAVLLYGRAAFLSAFYCRMMRLSVFLFVFYHLCYTALRCCFYFCADCRLLE